MQNNQSADIYVPASSANLGPGFDVLGIALNLYNKLTVEKIDGDTEIIIHGEGKDKLDTGQNNLIYRAFVKGFEYKNQPIPNVRLTSYNKIPLSRGLGSSSAAICAGLLAAQHLLNYSFTQEEMLNLAAEIDGHGDNTTAALLGGMTIARYQNHVLTARKISAKLGAETWLLIPDYSLPTSEARKVLPASYSRDDVIQNLAALSLLLYAIYEEDESLLKSALQDKIHVDYRLSLMPGMKEAIDFALSHGALGATVSGAGSTIIIFTKSGFPAEPVHEYLKNNCINANFLQIDPSYIGAYIEIDGQRKEWC